MNRFGGIKLLGFFVLGALGPLIPKLTPGTVWLDLSTPYYVLGVAYTGVVAVVAYLIQSPISPKEIFDGFKSTDTIKDTVDKMTNREKSEG